MQQYCISWALGRCGDESAIPTLERLHSAPASSDKVKRIALVAWLALAKAESRSAVLNRVLSYLPAELQSVLSLHNPASLRQLLSNQLGKTLAYDVLEPLYLLADDYPHAHAVVNEWMESISWGAAKSAMASTFRCVRHIFKIAEFREDAQTFGILARRFEKEPHRFHVSSWSDSAYVEGHYYENVIKRTSQERIPTGLFQQNPRVFTSSA
jgi:hypothetical protein